MSFTHTPVMLDECLEALAICPEGVYLDGTAGGGGHSAAIAQRLAGGHLWALDQDPDAVAAAARQLAGLPATVVRANFRDAAGVMKELGVEALDGALLDLGVSSHQLDQVERGFSYHGSAPLDMRMSQSGPTAADLVNTLDREQLSGILGDYGEEPYAWQIAGKIVTRREGGRIETTDELVDIIRTALPPEIRRKEKNPARRTFQALRIALNEEFEALEAGMDGLFGMLNEGGRLAVITFHSLEDRIVKQRFKSWTVACTCPPDFPICVCGGKARGRLVGKKPVLPTEKELNQNRHSRSAKLRVIEKIESQSG